MAEAGRHLCWHRLKMESRMDWLEKEMGKKNQVRHLAGRCGRKATSQKKCHQQMKRRILWAMRRHYQRH